MRRARIAALIIASALVVAAIPATVTGAFLLRATAERQCEVLTEMIRSASVFRATSASEGVRRHFRSQVPRLDRLRAGIPGCEPVEGVQLR